MLNESFLVPGFSEETSLPEVAPSQPMNQSAALDAENSVFLSVQDVSRLLGIAAITVYRLVARRALPTYRLVRRILFRRSDVERWLAAHRTEPRDSRLCR